MGFRFTLIVILIFTFEYILLQKNRQYAARSDKAFKIVTFYEVVYMMVI